MAFGKRPVQPPSAKDRALRLLSRREHSTSELRQKLRQRGHDSEESEAALEELSRDNYQSDERYTEAIIRHRSSAGYGPRYIESELRSNGIPATAFRAQLDAVDWTEIAQAQIDRKLGRIERNRENARKACAWLIRRGFAPTMVLRLVGADGAASADEIE